MPDSGCGGVTAVLRLEFLNTTALLFNTLSLRLFAATHVAVLSIFCWRVPALTDGMTRYVSSANFTSELLGCNGFRSAAVTVNAASPMPDPCVSAVERHKLIE